MDPSLPADRPEILHLLLNTNVSEPVQKRILRTASAIIQSYVRQVEPVGRFVSRVNNHANPYDIQRAMERRNGELNSP